MTLRDVFETVIVPGGSRASLRIAHRVVFTLLPLWKLVRGRHRGLSTSFAPLVLVTSFTIWMGLLTVGFGLMAYAVRDDFSVPWQPSAMRSIWSEARWRRSGSATVIPTATPAGSSSRRGFADWR